MDLSQKSKAHHHVESHPEIVAQDLYDSVRELLNKRDVDSLRTAANILKIPNELRTTQTSLRQLLVNTQVCIRWHIAVKERKLAPGVRVQLGNSDVAVHSVQSIGKDGGVRLRGKKGCFSPLICRVVE